MVQAKKWILAHHFDGTPKDSDLQLVEETLPALKDGDVLLEAIFLSVDPYMRPYSARSLKEGDTMMGEQVAQVKESRNPNFPKGSYVAARVGWRSHTVTSDVSALRIVAPVGALPLSYHLGILGMPGMTAYFGLFEICHPKAGEVVLVNGAGGAVGSAVGQLAKIKGCKVIAFAGTEEKCRWLREDLKLDVVYNYKKVADQEEAIRQAAPEGVDVFFDNVGGMSCVSALRCMNNFGRVSMCGAISQYNAKGEELTGPFINYLAISKQLRMEGFLVYRWEPSRWAEGIKEMAGWIAEGKLCTKETVTSGFENMRAAFYGLFTGDNIGKAVVKV